jgi:hypothetical protein
MRLTCPNCRCVIEFPDAPAPEALCCPACGSTFRLEAEQTGPWAAADSPVQPGPVEVGQTVRHYRLGSGWGTAAWAWSTGPTTPGSTGPSP